MDTVTFSLEAGSCNNFYRGHEPHNRYANCWGDEDDALVLTIEQARALAAAWHGNRMRIVVSLKEEVTFADATDGFEREMFCAAGGEWFAFPHRERLAKMVRCDHLVLANRCKHCGALWCGDHGGFWYDGRTGRTIDEELRV
jgi:hypothetical protein